MKRTADISPLYAIQLSCFDVEMLPTRQCEEESGWEKELSEICVGQLSKYPMTEFLLVCLIHVALEVLSIENKSTTAASVIPLA